jgi:hypothetical protein
MPGRLTLSEGDRRVLATWAADCAEHVLPLFEAKAPGDSRPRAAIGGLRAFARGELKVGPARALSVAAHAAARDIGGGGDRAAAGEISAIRAAVAAARAAGQAVATAHMGAHARGAPAYAAVAAGLANPLDPGAADDELAWAIDRASPIVRTALAKLPEPPAKGGQLGMFVRRIHEAATQ